MVNKPAPNQLGLFGKSRATWAKLRHEFDIRFYEAQCKEPLALEDGLSHYLNIGWLHGFDPNRNFSTKDYLETNTDVANSGLNPFLHYIRHGKYEERVCKPSNFRESQINRMFGGESKFIAFVISELPTLGNSGGIGAAIEEQVKCAVKAGHNVVIFFASNDINTAVFDLARNKFEKESVALELIPLINNPGSPPPISNSYEVYKTLLKFEPQISTVVFSEYEGLGFHVSQARIQCAHFENMVVWVVLHGSTLWAIHRDNLLASHENQIIQDYLERSLVAAADLIISPSTYLVDEYVRTGWMTKQKSICYIKNPIGSKPTNEKPEDKKGKNIVFIGRGRSKGLLTFCRSLSRISEQLAQEGVSVTFLGLGSGIESLHALRAIESLSSSWNFQWVVYPSCDRTAVRQLLSYLRDPIVVVASQYENCPYAVLDALNDGYRTISSNIGGGPELYDVSTRAEFLFEANNFSSLAETIQKALKNPLVLPTVSPEVKAANEEWVHLFSIQKIKPLQQLRNLLDELPCVTIGITHFNRLHLLTDAVKSAMKQDYKGKLEIIVCDDGTPESDEKTQILDSLQQNGVIIVHQSNSYLGAARNSITSKAQGDFVLFLDDDDLLIPSAVSSMVRSMIYSSANVVSAMLVEMHSIDRPVVVAAPEKFVTRSSVKWIQVGGPLSLLSRRNLIGTATTMFRRRDLIELGGYSELYGIGFEDFEILIKFLINGKKIVVYPDPLFAYQTGLPSMLSTTRAAFNYRRVLDQIDSYYVDPEFRSLIELSAGETASQIDRGREQELIAKAGINLQIPVSTSPEETVENHKIFQSLIEKLDLVRASDAVRRGIPLFLKANSERTCTIDEKVKKSSSLLLEIKLQEDSGSDIGQLVADFLCSNDEFTEQEHKDFLSINWLRIVGQANWDKVLERFVAGSATNEISEDSDLVGLSILAFKFRDFESLSESLLKLIQLENVRYLSNHPDVEWGIPTYFSSGFCHFYRYGLTEGRSGFQRTMGLFKYVFDDKQDAILKCMNQCEQLIEQVLVHLPDENKIPRSDHGFKHSSLKLQEYLSAVV